MLHYIKLTKTCVQLGITLHLHKLNIWVHQIFLVNDIFRKIYRITI